MKIPPKKPDPRVDAVRSVPSLIPRLWQRYVVDSLAAEEASSREAIAAVPHERIAWKVIGIFVVTAISLTLLEYLGKSQNYWDYAHPQSVVNGTVDILKMRFAQDPGAAPRGWHLIGAFTGPIRDVYTPQAQLQQLLYWATWCVIAYLVIPALFVRLVLREKLRDYGLRMRGTLKHMWAYALMFLVVLPAVYVVSGDKTFQLQYPFYRAAARNPQGFLIWELAYALQFFSLEFFFRGFMIHGLKHRLGAYSVMAMVVPYTMIHFGKPMPETFGAIIAGTVLGVLSLRTGSIVLGFLIHVSVALSMDVTSLWRKGQLWDVLSGLFN